MPLCNPLLLLLCTDASAQRHLQEFDGGDSDVSSGVGNAIALGLIVASFVPVAIILALYIRSRFCRNNDQDESAATTGTSTSLTKQKRSLALLEKIFSGDIKRWETKDVLPQDSIIGNRADEIIEMADEEMGNAVELTKIHHKQDASQSNDNGTPLHNHKYHSTFEQNATKQKYNIIDENEDTVRVNDRADGLDCNDPSLEKGRNLCPICLEQFNEEELIIASKDCPHVFHKNCILSWLEKHDACPCCRVTMITDDTNPGIL